MEYIAEQIEFDYGITLKVYPDNGAQNPRKEFDYVGTMVCAHRRYDLGDVQVSDLMEHLRTLIDDECHACEGTHVISDEEVQRRVLEEYVVLPLYLYDHSGLSMSTSTFGCPWDSGLVGYIYVDKHTARQEWGDDAEKDDWKRVKECLKAEVEEYHQYLTGDVYGYVVEDGDGEHLCSCWGYYGLEFAIEDGKEMAEHCMEEAIKALEAEAAAELKEKAELQFWAERDVMTV